MKETKRKTHGNLKHFIKTPKGIRRYMILAKYYTYNMNAIRRAAELYHNLKWE